MRKRDKGRHGAEKRLLGSPQALVKPTTRRGAAELVGKDVLEVERLRNEIYWNTGWRRFVDRFISPVTLGAVAVVISASVAASVWNAQRIDEELRALQRDLLIPGLSRIAAKRMLSLGERSFGPLWQILTSEDSAHLPAALTIVAAVADSARHDSSITNRYLEPLLTYGLNPRIGKLDPLSIQTVGAALNAVSPTWAEMKEATSSDGVVSSKLQPFFSVASAFGSWQHKWLTQNLGPQVAVVDTINGRLVVPAGYFVDSLQRIAWLPGFWVKVPRMPSEDSIRLQRSLDSTHNEQLFLVVARSAALCSIAGETAGETCRYAFAKSTDTDESPDSSVYTFEIRSRWLLGFVDSQSIPSAAETALMRWKLNKGVYGSFYSEVMYAPEVMKTLRYARYPDGRSRLRLPYP